MSAAIIYKKICLLGDYAVGKTSLVRRFIYDRFEDKYLSTIGVKVSRKMLTLTHASQTVELTFLLWDLAGSEEYNGLRASYLRGAAGALLVCDLTRPKTFDHLPSYLDYLNKVCPQAKIVLAANKADLVPEARLSPTMIEAYAATLQAPYFLTSAKTGDQVETIFHHMGQLVMGSNDLG